MVINPSGYSGVFLIKKKKYPFSMPLGDFAQKWPHICYGLDANTGARTMTGLEPRDQSSLIAA